MVKKKPSAHGGPRVNAGRRPTTLKTTSVVKHSAFKVRDLLGANDGRLCQEDFDPKVPTTFLTIVTVIFIVTRVLMDHVAGAIDFTKIELKFGGRQEQFYRKAVLVVAQARNGMRKLSAPVTLRESCREFIGRHCTLPEVMFCSQLHSVRPSAEDPFTRACVQWLREVLRDEPRKLSQYEWLTLKCFGRLRQAAAVSLLLPASSNYVGFCVIETAAQLGTFIGAQDAVEWQQQQTQEMSRVPGTNSQKASVCLSLAFALLRSGTFLHDIEACQTYYDLVNAWQALSGNGKFTAKNCGEAVLIAIHFAGYDA